MTFQLQRRSFVRHALLAGAGIYPPLALAQATKANASGGPAIVQVADISAGQADVSKDFLVGSRAAWLELNARGGLRNKPVRHVVLEVDGSAKSLNSAIETVKNMPDCVAVAGTVGDRLASQVAALLRQDMPDMPHVAPWLHSVVEGAVNTFSIFATRQEQIAFALKSLAVMGVTEIGLVYGGAAEVTHDQDDINRLAVALNLRLRAYQPTSTLGALASTLHAQSPRILIFLGGTPELAQFAQGIERQATQRYIVAMSDVNVVALQQLGVSRLTPVIATQGVPPINSNLPLVRNYREALNRQFDEPPSAQSLAGYVSARYCAEVLQRMEGTLSRANALMTFAKRQVLDIGGLRLNPEPRQRTNAFVTQSMLAADGKIIG